MRNLRVYPRIERKHYEDVIRIDNESFGEPSSPAALRNAERNPWAYTILTFHDSVQGYGLVLPVDRFARVALIRGEIGEDEIMDSHVTLPEDCDAFYIASVASKQSTHLAIRSRLVGYSLGIVLRNPKLTLAVAVSESGDSIAREIGLKPKHYSGQFKGIRCYIPTLFLRQPFKYHDNLS